MLNWIWMGMILTGTAYGLCTGHGAALSQAMMEGAGQAINLVLSMAGGMMLWMGIMEIARKSGLAQKMAKGLSHLLSPLFRGLSRDGAAMGAVCMNLACNVLGLGNAATPFGLSAMRELQKRNPHPREATDAQVTLIVINCCIVQLIPTTLINLRIAAGSAAPMAIVWPSILATFGTTVVGVVLCLWVHRKR